MAQNKIGIQSIKVSIVKYLSGPLILEFELEFGLIKHKQRSMIFEDDLIIVITYIL
jgi:hypothetical protein